MQRHRISRLPDVKGRQAEPAQVQAVRDRYFHIDIAEVMTAQGKPHLFVAIDQTSKFAFVRALIKAVPYRVHTVLTDNGIQFTDPRSPGSVEDEIKEAIAAGEFFRARAFDYACAQLGVEHRLTRSKHPWTNGQVEQMNRMIKEAIVKRFHHEAHDQLRSHLADFLDAYNYARRLKTLKGLTPYEFICKRWTAETDRFTLNPLHQMPGLNI